LDIKLFNISNLDVKLDALDGGGFAAAAGSYRAQKNDTKWRLILFKLFNYNLQFTIYNITIITNHIIIQHHILCDTF
jgi:hypothetical protein